MLAGHGVPLERIIYDADSTHSWEEAVNTRRTVMHFAGLKAVCESVAQPLAYYDNNVQGSVVLAETMAAHDVRTLVFSSSATVYGEPYAVPIRAEG